MEIAKTVRLDTSAIDGGAPQPVPPIRYESTIDVPPNGKFSWHVNPSPRPSQRVLDHPVEIVRSPGPGAARA